MNLNTIAEVRDATAVSGGTSPWQEGDSWLAGGTWLYSEPQANLRRLLDLRALGWEPLNVSDDGLHIAATCTIAELYAFPGLEDGRYELAIGTAEFGNGTTTQHAQIAATTLGTTISRMTIVQSDTDKTGFDTGAFASTGTTVAGKAVALAAEAMRDRILDFAAADTGVERSMSRLDDDAIICGEVRVPPAGLHRKAEETGHVLALSRKGYGSPRSVAFNVHGFRIGVHRVTGEILILLSVHAADAGTVINPMQLRGQVEGAVSQGIGWALYERIVIDDTGKVVNPRFRDYRIPAYADIPRTEIHFADTHDSVGPLGAKGMGECPINPVAPALANAIADATGIRFRDLPFRPDLIYEPIFEQHGMAGSA
jgi:putative selenate reductase molybdopterin-binding subunit